MYAEMCKPFVLYCSNSGSWRHRERRNGTQGCTWDAVLLPLLGSWNTCPVKRGWGNWVCSSWRRDGFRGTQQQLPVPMGGSVRVQSCALCRDAQRRKDRCLELELSWKVEGAGGRGKGWELHHLIFGGLQTAKAWAAWSELSLGPALNRSLD